jgi:hypothetical protein
MFVQSPQMLAGRFFKSVSALLLAKLKHKLHVQANTRNLIQRIVTFTFGLLPYRNTCGGIAQVPVWAPLYLMSILTCTPCLLMLFDPTSLFSAIRK